MWKENPLQNMPHKKSSVYTLLFFLVIKTKISVYKYSQSMGFQYQLIVNKNK